MNFLSKIENEELRAEIQAAVEAEIENAKELVRNDADAVKEYKMQGFKEAERKVLRDLKKAFNLDATDLEDTENYSEWFNVALSKFKDQASATGQEWQDKYMALKDDFNRIKEEEIPALKSQAESQIKSFKIDNILNSRLSKIENLAISVDDLKLLAKAKFNQLGVVLDLNNDGVTALTDQGTKPTIEDKALDFDGLINHVVSPYVKKNGVSENKPTQSFAPVNASDKISPKKAEIINKYKAMGVEVPASLLG
jgi:hypothetical protein